MQDGSDYSEYLYHWIKTDYYGSDKVEAMERAFEVMLKIFEDGYLKASGKDTYRRIKSVCFTESPKEVKRHESSRYQAFGFAFRKRDIFEDGGRHVIYQTREEAEMLPKSMRWRHVTYDPSATKKRAGGIDFTWEREWRLHEPKLSIVDCHAVIVPNQDYIERLRAEIEHWQGFPAYMWENAETHVDMGAYKHYTPEYIECFEILVNSEHGEQR